MMKKPKIKITENELEKILEGKSRTLKYYYRNLEKSREKSRQRYYKNRKKVLKRRKIYSQTKEGKMSACKASKKKREKYPERHKAYWKVKEALKHGRLFKLPCACCGDEKTEAHHEDYELPLDVIWLCKHCHTKAHRISYG